MGHNESYCRMFRALTGGNGATSSTAVDFSQSSDSPAIRRPAGFQTKHDRFCACMPFYPPDLLLCGPPVANGQFVAVREVDQSLALLWSYNTRPYLHWLSERIPL